MTLATLLGFEEEFSESMFLIWLEIRYPTVESARYLPLPSYSPQVLWSWFVTAGEHRHLNAWNCCPKRVVVLWAQRWKVTVLVLGLSMERISLRYKIMQETSIMISVRRDHHSCTSSYAWVSRSTKIMTRAELLGIWVNRRRSEEPNLSWIYVVLATAAKAQCR